MAGSPCQILVLRLVASNQTSPSTGLVGAVAMVVTVLEVTIFLCLYDRLLGSPVRSKHLQKEKNRQIKVKISCRLNS